MIIVRWHSAKGSDRPPPLMILIPLSIDVRVQIGEDGEDGARCTWAFSALSSATLENGWSRKNEWYDASDGRPIVGVTKWGEVAHPDHQNTLTKPLTPLR